MYILKSNLDLLSQSLKMVNDHHEGQRMLTWMRSLGGFLTETW